MADVSTTKSVLCRYFQKGECRYGARCRYDHFRRTSGGQKELISRGKIFKQNDPNQNMAVELASPSADVPGPSGSQSSVVSENSSYAEKVRGTVDEETAERERLARLSICDYYLISGSCPDRNCRAVHGDFCHKCSKYILHPHNKALNEQHERDCSVTHQRQEELTAAISRSARLSCGVCMEIVLDKDPVTLRRFGILENCAHVFCLDCIRKWRQVRNVDVKSARGCPECRTPSDFVTPSPYFVESGDEKSQLISGYKAALATKPCKYFNKGKGTCPFANRCFYKHALPDGTIAPDAGPPTVRRRYDSNGAHTFEDLMFMELINDYLPGDDDFMPLEYDDFFEEDSFSDEDDYEDYVGFDFM